MTEGKHIEPRAKETWRPALHASELIPELSAFHPNLSFWKELIYSSCTSIWLAASLPARPHLILSSSSFLAVCLLRSECLARLSATILTLGGGRPGREGRFQQLIHVLLGDSSLIGDLSLSSTSTCIGMALSMAFNVPCDFNSHQIKFLLALPKNAQPPELEEAIYLCLEAIWSGL